MSMSMGMGMGMGMGMDIGMGHGSWGPVESRAEFNRFSINEISSRARRRTKISYSSEARSVNGVPVTWK